MASAICLAKDVSDEGVAVTVTAEETPAAAAAGVSGVVSIDVVVVVLLLWSTCK
jgi:hypothetical protein